MGPFSLYKEACIRSFGVGLLAIATLAVASIVLHRARVALATITGGDDSAVDELYAAGL